MHPTPTAAHAAGLEDIPLRLSDGGTLTRRSAWPFPSLLPALRGEQTPSGVLAGLTPLQRARHEQQAELIKRDIERTERLARAAARQALQARIQAPAQEALL